MTTVHPARYPVPEYLQSEWGPDCKVFLQMVDDMPSTVEFTYGDSPEDVAGDNLLRAQMAAVGLGEVVVNQYLRGNVTETAETVLSDFVANLRHLVDALGFDWHLILDSADTHYRAELRGAL